MAMAPEVEARFERIEQVLEHSQQRQEEERQASAAQFAEIRENLRLCTQIAMRTDARLDRVSDRLDRAVRVSVREARNERRKRQDVDERLTKLANTVQAFIDSMKRGGNGNG